MKLLAAYSIAADPTLWPSGQGLGGLLAQGGAQGANDLTSPIGLFLPVIAVMVLAYFMLMRPQQAKQREFDQMLAGLKENDHVVTVGGVYGVITSIQRDAQRVTLRVDDSAGTKIKVALWAISHTAEQEAVNNQEADKATAGAAKNAPAKSGSTKK